MTATATPDPGCEATTRHGDENAYTNHGCRCAAAGRAMRRARLWRELHGDGPRVHIAGTQRRIRALVIAGWTINELTRRLGSDVSRSTLWHVATGIGTRRQRMTTVRRATAACVAELYDEIHAHVPPVPQGSNRKRAENFRAKALRWKWVGPERWTDETIDDPTAHCLPRRPLGEPFKHEVDSALVAKLVARYGRTPSAQQLPRFPTAAEVDTAIQWNRAHHVVHEEGVRVMHDALCTLNPERQYQATKRMYDRHAYEETRSNATTAAA